MYKIYIYIYIYGYYFIIYINNRLVQEKHLQLQEEQKDTKIEELYQEVYNLFLKKYNR